MWAAQKMPPLTGKRRQGSPARVFPAQRGASSFGVVRPWTMSGSKSGSADMVLMS